MINEEHLKQHGLSLTIRWDSDWEAWNASIRNAKGVYLAGINDTSLDKAIGAAILLALKTNSHVASSSAAQ